MKYDDIYIIELSRAAVFDDVPYLPDEKVDWEYIYGKSIEQNISGLLYSSVYKIAEEADIDKGLLFKWQEEMNQNVMLTGAQYSEFGRMRRVLKNNNIDIVGLKGCVICNIYPAPELRTMGDFDVLCRKDDMSAVRSIFEKEGYTIIDDVYGMICEKSRAYWEVFYSVRDEFRVNSDEWDKRLFADTAEINGVACPNYTAFFLHLICHTAKHFLREGAGIRNFCDIALFLKNYDKFLDYGLIDETVKEQGVVGIYNYIMNVIHGRYGLDLSGKYESIPEEKVLDFLEYSLANGVFGKGENTLISQVSKNEDNSIGGYRKIFFPSVEILKLRYRYLEKYPFLLPVAWVNRFFRAIFKWKYSVKDLVGDIKEAADYSDERIRRLENLGLLDESKK